MDSNENSERDEIECRRLARRSVRNRKAIRCEECINEEPHCLRHIISRSRKDVRKLSRLLLNGLLLASWREQIDARGARVGPTKISRQNL